MLAELKERVLSTCLMILWMLLVGLTMIAGWAVIEGLIR